ncbi:MAG TPA: hypothetical protein DCY91_16430 [Cyanobacteria bacterium UBA11370]|nr:hypothetical protein [Cyanobacteria bacterium UBA11370]
MFQKLLLPEEDYVQVSICLNRVDSINMNPLQTLSSLEKMGYQPELRYQIDPDHEELHLYAVIHEKHLDESEMTDEKCHQLWNIFGNTSVLYVIGTGLHERDKWLAICDLDDFSAKQQEYHQYLATVQKTAEQKKESTLQIPTGRCD